LRRRTLSGQTGRRIAAKLKRLVTLVRAGQLFASEAQASHAVGPAELHSAPSILVRFRELQTKSVDGFRYVVLKPGDGSFLHFFEAENGASPMAGIEAFQLFQAGVRDRCLEPPQVSEAAVIGNYRMLSER
jgi:hypothetical protein